MIVVYKFKRDEENASKHKRSRATHFRDLLGNLESDLYLLIQKKENEISFAFV